jgi:CBS domain containing-hemolysin-like protein
LDGDPLPVLLNFALVIFLVLLNGFFVAAEFAMVKIRGSRIDALALEGNRNAKFAQAILNNLNGYLSACQLGITLASLALGWVGEPAIARLIEPTLSGWGVPEAVIHAVSFAIAFTLITSLHITIGEQVPKTYAIRKAEQVTLLSSGIMVVFYKLMYPLIWFLNGTSNWMLRKSGIEPEDGHESVHTEEEIRVLMKESHKSGYIDNTELTLVDNIFDFADTNAREIMIPRTEMNCLYANLSFEENRDIAVRELHTRFPVCDPDKDNIIGFVHIKDIMKHPNITDIKQITRPLLSVPESVPISQLLKQMQKRKTEMALLIDEYGGTSGLVTIEDILEEIVGEIQDEFDQEERPRIEKRDEATFSVDGMLHIDEINDQFGLVIETDDYDTIGGWIYSQIEVPPRKNQMFDFNGFQFMIEEVENRRVSRILVRKLAMPSSEEELSEAVS